MPMTDVRNVHFRNITGDDVGMIYVVCINWF